MSQTTSPVVSGATVTVEQVRTPPMPVPRPGVARTGARLSVPPRQAGADESPLCLVIPEIGDGEATALVRSLRRRESTRVVLLGGGVRGAVTADPAHPTRAVSKSPAIPAGTPALTAREVGVLRLVAEGRSNREIGEHLSLSALTVKSHLARISRKVGTGDRAEMVAFAIRHDLLR